MPLQSVDQCLPLVVTATKKLVDPELRPILDSFPSFNFSADTLPLIRQQVKEMFFALPQPSDNGVSVKEQIIPGPEGGAVRLLIYSPPDVASMRPAFLHIHGGGYVVGMPEMAHGRNYDLCKEMGCVIVSVDYRLPPEHPYPAPIEDCYAALKWLHSHAASLGVDVTKIVVGGESAGGGLAAALCLLARDRNEVPICFQWLIYPMLDDRTCVKATNPNTGEFLWTRDQNLFGWTSLLGGAPGSAETSEYASPARADRVVGLPPTFIGVGALDLFLEENVAYALRLMHGSVATELHVYPGAFHGFDTYAPDAEVSKQFNHDMRQAMRRGLLTKCIPD